MLAAPLVLMLGCGNGPADATESAAAAAPAGAGGDACVTRFSATMMGQRSDNTSCIENVSQAADAFRAGCEQAAQADAAMQGESSPEMQVHEASTEFTSAGCPANADARCDGVNNGQVNFLYFGHSADQLVALEQACGLRGGDWKG